MKLRLLMVLLPLLASIVACGFQLRGDVDMPPVMQKIYLDYPGGDRELRHAVMRALSLSGVELVESPPNATARLRLLAAPVVRRVLARDIRGRPREYELSVALRFLVTDIEGSVLVPRQEVARRRNLLLDPSDPLGNRGDIDYLVQTMRTDAVWEMLRRISAADMAVVIESQPDDEIDIEADEDSAGEHLEIE